MPAASWPSAPEVTVEARQAVSAACSLGERLVALHVLLSDLEVQVAVLDARLDFGGFHPLVERADHDRPGRIGRERAMPGRLVIRSIATIPGAGGHARG